jgi:hypothetical protein
MLTGRNPIALWHRFEGEGHRAGDTKARCLNDRLNITCSVQV